MKKQLLPFLLLISLQLKAQTWQAYEPILPEKVGTYDLRIAEGDNNVVWAIAMKYEVTAAFYNWQPLDSLVFTKTSDGGETWEGGKIPMGVEPYASNICPVNAETAWASGVDMDFASYILRTTDGGQTWARFLEDQFLDVASYVNFVYFWDEQNGMVMGDPAVSDTDPTPFFEIYTTADGGQNWTRSASQDIPAPLPNEFGYSSQYQVRGDTVWFSTFNGTNGDAIRMFRSVDKGITWTASAISAFMPFSFADGQYGVAAQYVSNIKNNLRLTTDGGTTWTDLPPLMMGNLTSLAMIPESRYILAVVRTNNINGPFKTILSTDLGQTWTVIGEGEHAGNAQFRSPSVGYAGEWPPANHPTRMYRWAGNPLSGLLSGKALDAEVTVFPNPASDFVLVNVETAQPADFLLLVNDAQGRLVERQVIEKTGSFTASFDLRSLPVGVYSLTVSTAEGMLTKKVLKQ